MVYGWIDRSYLARRNQEHSERKVDLPFASRPIEDESQQTARHRCGSRVTKQRPCLAFQHTSSNFDLFAFALLRLRDLSVDDGVGPQGRDQGLKGKVRRAAIEPASKGEGPFPSDHSY